MVRQVLDASFGDLAGADIPDEAMTKPVSSSMRTGWKCH